jgi:ADP-ribose pyrophosphatase
LLHGERRKSTVRGRSLAEGIRQTQERLVYENRFLRLYDDEVRFPNGDSGTYVRATWRSPYSVAVLAKTANQEYVLIRQYNYARGDWLIQVPKGMGDDGLDPLGTARKELLEETGYDAECFSILRTMYVDPGLISNPMFLVLAKGAKWMKPPERERAEAISGVLIVDQSTVRDQAWLGQITDVVTLLAILNDRLT